MKSKPLTVRFSFLTIVGCYDLHEGIGRQTVNKPMSSIIGEALDAIIGGMRAEERLPSYTDDELTQRLAQIMQGRTPLPFSAGQVGEGDFDEPTELEVEEVEDLDPREAEQDGIKDALRRSVESAVEEVDKQPEISSLVQLPVKPPVIVQDEIFHEKSPALVFERIESLALGDGLVKACKGDNLKEESLLITYANLPREQWGTPLAKSLQERTLKILREEGASDAGQSDR